MAFVAREKLASDYCNVVCFCHKVRDDNCEDSWDKAAKIQGSGVKRENFSKFIHCLQQVRVNNSLHNLITINQERTKKGLLDGKLAYMQLLLYLIYIYY